MKFNPDIHHRRSIRLKGHDYSQEGLYFITICTQNRMHLFGEIKDGEMILNEYGGITEKCLLEIPDHYPHAKLRQFVVMPNHIHFIIEITVKTDVGLNVGANVGANNYSPLQSTPPPSSQSPSPPPTHGTSKTIGSIVRGFKIGVTQWFHKNTDIHTVWQRNYYEHIIRDKKSYHQILEYIQTNLLKWKDDQYYD